MGYQLALFAHILGVLLYFVGVGVEVLVLRGLHRARLVEQVLVWLQAGQVTLRLFRVATPLILVAGLSMTLTAWGMWTPWIDVSLVLLVVFAILGPLVNGGRFKAIGQAAAAQARSSSEISADLKGLIEDSVLRTSIHVMAAASVGIVLLMTIKPNLLGSLATIAVAMGVGWSVAWVLNGRQRVSLAPLASVDLKR